MTNLFFHGSYWQTTIAPWLTEHETLAYAATYAGAILGGLLITGAVKWSQKLSRQDSWRVK